MKRKNKEKYREVKFPRYGEGLQHSLNTIGKSHKELACFIGRSQGSVSDYCQGYTLPDRTVQEDILKFLSDRVLCSELHDHHHYYKEVSDTSIYDSYEQIYLAPLEDASALMSEGKPRQAIALIDGLLQYSVNEKMRLALQELNFEVHFTSGNYTESSDIAIQVAREHHDDSEVPEFRSLAMLGIVLRAQGREGLKKAYEHLEKAIGIGYRSQKIPESQLAIVKRMKAMTEIDGMLSFGSIEKDHIKHLLKTLHLHIDHPTCPEDKGNAIEAAARCYLMLGTPETANQILETLSQEEIDRVRSLEERLLIRKGVILRTQGELDEALEHFKDGVRRCKQKSNFHHLRFANSGLITLQALVKSPI